MVTRITLWSGAGYMQREFAVFVFTSYGNSRLACMLACLLATPQAFPPACKLVCWRRSISLVAKLILTSNVRDWYTVLNCPVPRLVRAH